MNNNYTELSSALLKDFKSFIIQKMEVERFSKFINHFNIEFTQEDYIACTDNEKVYLSKESEFKSNFIEFCKKHKIKKMEITFYMGLLIHEIGHILYTDFNFKGLKYDEAQFINILEDGYIEKRLINTSSGVLIDSLILLRMYHRNNLEKKLQDNVDFLNKKDSLSTYTFLCSEILLFAKFNRTIKGGLLEDFLKIYNEDYKKCFKEENRKEAQLKLYKDVLEFLNINSPTQEAINSLGDIFDNLTSTEEISNEKSSSAIKLNIKNKESIPSKEIEESVEKTLSKLLSLNSEKGEKDSSEEGEKDSSEEGEKNSSEEGEKDSSEEDVKDSNETSSSKKSEIGAGGGHNDNRKNSINANSELNLNERKNNISNNEKVSVIHDKTTKIEGKKDVQSLSKIIKNKINKKHPKLEEIMYSSIRVMRDSVIVSEAGKQEVKIAKHKYKSQYKKLANSLKKIIPEDEPFYIKATYNGKIDATSVGNKLHSNNYNFFKKKHIPAERRNISVALLLDESGSMCGHKIKASRDALLILNEAFKAIDLEPLIFGHTTYNRDVVVHSYSSLEGLYSLSEREMNSNVDYEALNYVYSEMDKINSDIKLVFVISDGLPCGKEREYADLINRDEEHNIKVFGCGIGSCANQVRNFFKKNIIIDDVEDFPKVATKILKKYL